MRLAARLLPALTACQALLLSGCGRTPPAAPAPERPAPQAGFVPAPTRGVILISIDALRADHLSAYGYERQTSPFLEELARRSTVFERAYAQVPSTLPSHMSMFTGLYPAEHGVFPPSSILAPEVRTLPEILQHAGFRTAGHSEGGYVQGGYGFRRGFTEWTDDAYTADTDVERTFGRGVDFLRTVKSGERFFLFLHTYTVHDPYTPPDAFAKAFWPGPPPPGVGGPTGAHFAAVNAGLVEATPAAIDYWKALYDGSILYLDDRLRVFFGELDRLGLAGETTVVFTSDHGEEFYEHGRLVHTQIYPECLHIPLIVVNPAQKAGTRVGELVQTIDFAPTIYDLAGVQRPGDLPGRSLRPLLEHPDAATSGEAYSEVKMLSFQAKSLLKAADGSFFQAIHAEAVAESDGFWASKEVSWDAAPPAVEFRAVAFQRPRKIEVSVDGRKKPGFEFGTDWATYRIDLAGASRKPLVRLSTEGCESPLSLGLGEDRRCLSFKIHGTPLERRELFDLVADPTAQRDLSAREIPRLRALLDRLEVGYRHSPRAVPAEGTLSDEQIRNLKALGYLQ
jgi:arylsulfatase A-like enzyme